MNMATTLLIPTALRGFTEDQAQVEVAGKTVGELLTSLTTDFPDISQHLFDDENRLRSYINIFVGDENIKDLHGLDTPVSENAEVSIVPAIAGGTDIRG
jgi:molybdopterin converting factor small subunit